MAFHVGAFLIALLILFSRRPDAILNAQFYAEDGTFWYADAYNHSWRCLFMAEAGYFHTVPRLVALFSLMFPLALAPLVMNLVAFFFQILPINLCLSSRFNSIPLNIRVLAGFLYIAVPNSFEIHANATNIQWHLALLACMVILARSPHSKAWNVFDVSILALASVDSPLGIPLIALVVASWWMCREKHAGLQLLALVPGTMIEIVVLLLSHTRRAAPNGASIERFIHILGGQVFLSSLLGVRTLIQLFHAQSLLIIDVAVMLIGLAVLGYALRHGPMELKLFLLFAATVFGLGLLHPLATIDGNHVQWEQLQVPGCGNRYYFFPMLAFLVSLCWMASTPALSSKVPRHVALALLFFLPIGIIRDWQYRPFDDLHFHEIAADFQRAPSGAQFVIPLNPGATMQLTKR